MDWFIADTHFYHKNVIAYSSRPWPNLEEMHESMIRLWNSRVAKDDRVFVLGDFAFGNKTMIKELVPQLQGKKILIKGNHDIRNGAFYVEAGFAAASPLPMYYDASDQGITEKFLLSHEPIFPQVGNLINIHGHLHDKVNPNFYAPAHFCVSVEQTDYRPVTIKQILAMLAQKNENYRQRVIDVCNKVDEYDTRAIQRELSI